VWPNIDRKYGPVIKLTLRKRGLTAQDVAIHIVGTPLPRLGGQARQEINELRVLSGSW
jgi:hypothetical protein